MNKFNMVIEHLYQFHFRHLKGQVAVYALTVVIALLYGVINALVMGRPEQSVAFEMIGLTVILLVGLPVAYVTVVIKSQARNTPADNRFTPASPLTNNRSWVFTGEIRKDVQIRPTVRLKEKIEAALTADSHNRERPSAAAQQLRPMEGSMTDEELMLRVKYNDDRDAFESLSKRHSRRSLLICQRYTGNKWDAEDVNVEVWMKIHRRRETFRDEGEFKAWLTVIAESAGKSWLRSSNQPSLSLLTTQTALPSLPSKDAEKLKRACGRLSPEERELLEQAYLDELLKKDMAEAWKISPPTLRSRLKRAQDKFEKHLLEEGIILAYRK